MLSSTSALSLTLGMDQSNPRSFSTNLLIIMRLGGIFKVRFGKERLQLEMGHQEKKYFSPNIEILSPSLNPLPQVRGCSSGFHFRVFKKELGGGRWSSEFWGYLFGSHDVKWDTEHTCVRSYYLHQYFLSRLLWISNPFLTLSFLVVVKDTSLCHDYGNRKVQGLLERQRLNLLTSEG